MHFWWSEWSLPKAPRTPTRPRVTQAVEAARMAQAGVKRGLGSARVDVAIAHSMEVVERAAASGPLKKATRRAQRGLSPDLLWATARAARESGREPEEVWAEALRTWLASRETNSDQGVQRPRSADGRRQRIWEEIDDTLEALRAS
jgi:hypothetical protein